MKIITFSGQAEHGKDTLALFVKEKLDNMNKKSLILHNADYLKFICKTYLGWDGKKDEIGRQKLQYVGTDKIRVEKNLPDFHVESIYRIIDIFQEDFDFYLIPDVRFPNEVTYLRNKGLDVVTTFINRINYNNSLTQEQRNHYSERAMDNFKFDYYYTVLEGLGESKIIAERLIKEVLL